MVQLLKEFPDSVVVLTDLQIPKSFTTSLRRHRINITEFVPSALDHAQRKEYLMQKLSGQNELLEKELDAFKWLMGGFELVELNRLVLALQFEMSKGPSKPFSALLHDSIEKVRNASADKPHIKMMLRGLADWDKIKGYPKAKAKIHDMLYGPWKDPEKYSKFNVKTPSGMLLYGPSGCGKSMFVQAVANDGIFNVLEIQL